MPKSAREYIYGINPAFEVLRGGQRKVFGGFLNETSKNNPRLRKLASLLSKHEIPVQWVSRHRLTDLAKNREHQGAVLKTSSYPYIPSEPLFETASFLLLLDNVEDPQNTGAILRSAEVFGFRHILLPVKGVPEVYPSVVKASAGATEFLTIARDRSANQYVSQALENGFTVTALDAAGKISLTEAAAETPAKLLLVVGGEDKSVGQHILNRARHTVRIPQGGRVSSLNASAAAAIALFHFSPAKRNRLSSPAERDPS